MEFGHSYLSWCGPSPSYAAVGCPTRVFASPPGVPARKSAPPAGPVFHLLGQARLAPVPCGLLCLLQEPAGCFPSSSAVWSSSSSIRPRVSPAEPCCRLALAARGEEGAVSEKDACCFAGERPPGGHQAGGCDMGLSADNVKLRVGETLRFKIWGISIHKFLSHMSGSHSPQPGL